MSEPSTTPAPATPKSLEVPAREKTRALIYIGPSLPPKLAALPQYRPYLHRIPEQFEPIMRRCPAIRELWVPTSQLSKARRLMATPGTREHTFAQVVAEFIANETRGTKPGAPVPEPQ